MADLIHGGDIYSFEDRKVIDFSANINPLGIPTGVKEAIISNLDLFAHYPDPLCRKLSDKIAKAEGVESSQVICGNGAADLIFRLAIALKPKKALVLTPTFAEYEIAMNTVDCEVAHYMLTEENNFEVDEGFICELKKNAYDIVFICNPNNPTGKLTNKKILLEVLQVCKAVGTLIMVDECFLEFCNDYEKITLKPYINEFSNLMILKAFTKIYAMPGLRLGYALTSNLELIEKLKSVAQPWAVSQIAQIAGIYALDEKEYVKNTIEQIQEEKEFLVSKLTELGIKVYVSEANYLLLNIKNANGYNALDFKQKLADEGILIRSCSNYRGLDENYFRIAIRNHFENLKLLEALSNILN